MTPGNDSDYCLTDSYFDPDSQHALKGLKIDVMCVIMTDTTTTPEVLLPWRPINTYVDCVITLVDVNT